jgi:hypothetical protein
MQRCGVVRAVMNTNCQVPCPRKFPILCPLLAEEYIVSAFNRSLRGDDQLALHEKAFLAFRVMSTQKVKFVRILQKQAMRS